MAKEKENALSFIPGPVRGMVTKLLCKKLKENNIKCVVLVYDESKGDDTDSFEGEFYPDNILDKIKALELENRQLKHKVEVLKNKK